jgi:hypothetical protein
VLGDGTLHVFDVYTGKIEWMSAVRTVTVLESETTPLVGMSLIAGSKLEIEALDGGSVILKPL